MVEVAETVSLALTAEKVIEFMGTEVELDAEFWRLNKKRMIDVHKSPDMCQLVAGPNRVLSIIS